MRRLLVVILAIAGMAAFADGPIVSDVTAKQRYPWNGLVDINCKVSGIDGTTNGLKFAVAIVMPDSGDVNKVSHFWIIKNGTNAVSHKVHANGDYRLLWDARADIGQIVYSNMVVRVTVADVHGKVQLWEGGPYWSDTNIGAEEPWECGYYFWWGDTVGYKLENDAWVASDGSLSSHVFKRYYTPTHDKYPSDLRREGWITADNVLSTEHDAAQVQCGGGWRTPTKQEFDDILDKCDWTWTTMNGINGYIVRGRDDYASASIFLPAAGSAGNDYDNSPLLYNAGSYGWYWSSVPYTGDSNSSWGTDCYSWGLGFSFTNSCPCNTYHELGRDGGLSVRPIQDATTALVETVGQAGDSAPFLLDMVTISASPVADSLTISWDTSWIGGDTNATVVIADNGTEVKRATGAGEFTHTLSGSWRHNLTYTTYVGGAVQEEVYSTTVYALHGVVTLTFDANGGTGGTSVTQDYGTAVAAPEVRRENYVFIGWRPTVSGTVPADDTTYVAQWRCEWTCATNADDTLTVTGVNFTPSGTVTVPSEIDGHPVTRIWSSVFAGCSNLTAVVIPKDVKSIGERAFAGCASLTGVMIPDAVTYIGASAFTSCSNLTEVVIPGGVWSIGEGAFADCVNLRRVEAPRGLKNMIEANNVFAGCSADLEIVYASAEVTGVTAKQRWPWNGKVDIIYTVTGNLTDGLPEWNQPTLMVLATNRVAGTSYVSDTCALSGDTGTAAGIHHVVWDLNAQGLAFESDDVVFTVAYSYRVYNYHERYCVIDLSAGTNAMCYPVTYMTDPPSDGFNTGEYKTTKLVLRQIDPGSFMMGGRYDVTLTKPFYCGLFEVTQKQYELVMGSNPSSSHKGDMRPVERVSWNMIRGYSNTYNWPKPANVDPNSFMGKIQGRTGLNFDLPTEAQWEYACRAGTTNLFNNGGSSENDLMLLGRYSGDKFDGKGGYSNAHTTVGSYLPNAWGLYDMHGNMWEWCLDVYGGLSSGVTDPVGPSSGLSRVLRSGSWNMNMSSCTSSYRLNYSLSSRNDQIGFRLARTLSSTNVEQISETAIEAERVGVLCSGDSSAVAVNSRVDAEPVLDSIVLPWDASWIGGNSGATVVITDNGTGVRWATGTGEFRLSGIGRHELTYKTYIGGVARDEVYTATVYGMWKYEVVDGGAVITATAQRTGAVTIPSEIDGYTVTGIGTGVFAACSNLTSVVVPGSVWSIGEGAFANCVSLHQVEAPRGLKRSIEANGVFAGCPADLEIIYVSAEITKVTAKQRWPWNGKVDITYTLTGDLAAGFSPEAEIVLSATASNRVDGTTYASAASALSGDTGMAEGAHHVIWDLNAQGLEIKSDDVVFTVGYAEKPKPYCVIDLSGGANASSYPVSYVADVPSGGFNTDEYKTTKLVLRLIEPGTFMMGDSYQVTLTKPFYCGIFEVTQKQYEQVTGSNPSYYKGDMRPVEQVSWNTIRGDSSTYNWPGSANVDSNSFVGRLQARTDLNFDLPTEAQWEYACRAGTTNLFNNGGGSGNDLMLLGRYSGEKSDGKGGYSQHTKVGSYEPNTWGLYDMHGNVYEWCLDWYGNLTSGVTDPVGSSSGSYRVGRGGGWSSSADYCTSSSRISDGPSYEGSYIGFRLARTLSNTEGERSPEAVAGAERADALCVSEAASVAIDSRVGMAPVLESVVLPWDATWIGGDTNATVVITDNGTEVRRATGAGEFTHTLIGDSRHVLAYTTYIGGVVQDEIYTTMAYAKWKYEVVDGGAVITETTQTSGTVTIPSEIDGYTVTGIGGHAFSGCEALTGIIIPGTVTSVGAYAFEGCVGLTEVTIPDCVTNIEQSVFSGCAALTKLTLPFVGSCRGNSRAVESVFGHIFGGMAADGFTETIQCYDVDKYVTRYIPISLNEVKITDETVVAKGAFDNCMSLTNLTLNVGVEHIGEYAFAHCKGIKTMRFPEGVVDIGKETLLDCTSLIDVSFPSNLVTISSGMCSGCGALMNVAFPAGLATIDDYAFDGCGSLTNVVIPSGVTFIGYRTFRDCGNLRTLTIPSSVSYMGYQAFRNCVSLQAVYIESVENWCRIQFGSQAGNPLCYAHEIYLNDELLTHLEIPQGVTEIQRFAFYNDYLDGLYLDSLSLPSGLVSIGKAAFLHCHFTNVTFSSSITTIDSLAFAGCTYLRHVTLPSDIGTLTIGGNNAFEATTEVSIEMRIGYAFVGWTNAMGQVITDPFHSSTPVTVSPCWRRLQVATPIIEPATSTSFANISQEVSISCDDADAIVLYTTDGSEPGVYGREYTRPFMVYESCHVRAIARKPPSRDSDEVAVTLTRAEGLSEAVNLYGYLMDVDGDHPWTVVTDVSHDGVSSVRSGMIGNSGTTWLQTSVRKAGTVSFWWKAACEAVEEDDNEIYWYDYGSFFVDGLEKAKIAGNDTGWRKVEVDIQTGGKHVLRWEYRKDGTTSYSPDCIWLDQVQWIPADGSGYTLTTPYPVPYSWLAGYNLGLDCDFETVAKRPTGKADANGMAMSVWQDYVAGTNPTNMNDFLRAVISYKNGVPLVEWTPNLNSNGEVRIYTVLGKTNLTDAVWTCPTNAAHRFFKVKVEMR